MNVIVFTLTMILELQVGADLAFAEYDVLEFEDAQSKK